MIARLERLDDDGTHFARGYNEAISCGNRVLDTARTEIAELHARIDRLNKIDDERAAELTRLKSCEVDARRYRHLRGGDDHRYTVYVISHDEDVELFGSELDEAMDAAIAQSQPQPLPGGTVTTMALCEIGHVVPHTNQLYRFVVMPDCEQCAELAKATPAKLPGEQCTWEFVTLSDGREAAKPGCAEFRHFYRDAAVGNCPLCSKPVKLGGELCGDCPPVGYPTDKTRCAECPRNQNEGSRK